MHIRIRLAVFPAMLLDCGELLKHEPIRHVYVVVKELQQSEQTNISSIAVIHWQMKHCVSIGIHAVQTSKPSGI